MSSILRIFCLNTHSSGSVTMFRQWTVVTLILSLLFGNVLATSVATNKIHAINSDKNNHVMVVCTGSSVKFFNKAIYFATGELIELDGTELPVDTTLSTDCPLIYVIDQKNAALFFSSTALLISQRYSYISRVFHDLTPLRLRFLLPTLRGPPVFAS